MNDLHVATRNGLELARCFTDGDRIIHADLLLCCMNSQSLTDKAIAFDVLTDTRFLKKIDNLNILGPVHEFCLAYLLQCIISDIPFNLISDLDELTSHIHTKGEAYFELGVVFCRDLQSFGFVFEMSKFWRIVGEFFENMENYDPDCVTHFLEGWPLGETTYWLAHWRASSKLNKYVIDLEEILGGKL